MLGLDLSLLMLLLLQGARPFVSVAQRNQQVLSKFARSIMSSSSGSSSSTGTADDLLTGQLEIPIETAMACHGNNVVFFDGTWWLGEPDKGRQGFETGPRIAGANFYDIDDVASKGPALNPKGLPHMMPPPALQAAYMDALGVTNHHHVIVYGQASDCPFLHRAWYQIMAMGHGVAKTHLLAGSLQDWITAGGPVETGEKQVLKADDCLNTTKSVQYQASAPTSQIVSMDELVQIINQDSSKKNTQIVDARSAERFLAQVDEPRPGLKRGHMPGAANVFFKDVLQPDSLVQLRDKKTLQKLLQSTQLDNNKRIVATCGSGATGCTLLAALVKAGYDPKNLALYDESWAGWGAPDMDVPIVNEQEQQSK